MDDDNADDDTSGEQLEQEESFIHCNYPIIDAKLAHELFNDPDSLLGCWTTFYVGPFLNKEELRNRRFNKKDK